jgi:hypothetical protein
MGKHTKDTQASSKRKFRNEKEMVPEKGLRKWDENLDQIANDKREAFKKYLSTETLEDQSIE